MHPSVLEFVEQQLGCEQVCGATVLEVGSYDVNGTVRPYLKGLGPFEYLGVDAQEGPGVDRVVDCEQLCAGVGAGIWRVVISTEMLEHVRDWKTCMEELAEAVALDGLLLITTRSPGFGYHPFPEDHWRYTLDDMEQIIDALGLKIVALEDDWQYEGVFVLARKPFNWPNEADYRKLDGIKVMEVLG